MRQTMISAVALGIVLACGVTVAEHKSAEGEKLLKKWGDQTVGGVWSTTPEDGDKREATYTWLLEKKFLRVVIVKEGKDPGKTMGLYGVDPETGQVAMWWFASSGGIADGVLTPEEDGWVQHFEGFLPGKGSGEIRNRITVVDQNTHKTLCLRYVVNGVEQELSGEVRTWTRKKAEK